MRYYICGYCGKSKVSLLKSKRPKCGCSGGGGKTYMTRHPKGTFKRHRKNARKMKRLK
jgi:hypothetical protein